MLLDVDALINELPPEVRDAVLADLEETLRDRAERLRNGLPVDICDRSLNDEDKREAGA